MHTCQRSVRGHWADCARSYQRVLVEFAGAVIIADRELNLLLIIAIAERAIQKSGKVKQHLGKSDFAALNMLQQAVHNMFTFRFAAQRVR